MNKVSISVAALLLALLCGPGVSLDIPKNASLALLTMPDGSIVKAELAITPQIRERGLMLRETLPNNRGMLFVFTEGGSKTFNMKNTYIGLDIVFLDSEMKISNIYNHVPSCGPDRPESEASKVSAPANFMLALASGKAVKSGLKPGYTIKVSFPRDKNMPPAVKSSTAPAAPRK